MNRGTPKSVPQTVLSHVEVWACCAPGVKLLAGAAHDTGQKALLTGVSVIHVKPPRLLPRSPMTRLWCLCTLDIMVLIVDKLWPIGVPSREPSRGTSKDSKEQGRASLLQNCPFLHYSCDLPQVVDVQVHFI